MSDKSLKAAVDAYHMLGIWVNALTAESLYALIAQSIRQRERCVIGYHNLHSIHLDHQDPQMRAFYDQVADYVFIDGMPLILWGRVLGFPLKQANRLTAVDWLPSLMEKSAQEGWRVFYLGGRPGVAEAGAARFRDANPGLVIRTEHGYFDVKSESDCIIATINAFAPDMLLIGMGMPRQEHWVLRHHSDLHAPCIIPVGAAMDYFAGAIPTPPRWIGRLGLEWLARLIAEPGRLWRRYLVEPWSLLPFMLADLRRRRSS